MSNNEKVNTMLTEFVRQLKAHFGNKLSDVILFGSYARGNYDDESDVDILLLMNIPREEEHLYNTDIVKIMEQTYDISGYSIVLSPIVISHAFFNEWKNDLPFYKNIISEGVSVVAWGDRSYPNRALNSLISVCFGLSSL